MAKVKKKKKKYEALYDQVAHIVQVNEEEQGKLLESYR